MQLIASKGKIMKTFLEEKYYLPDMFGVPRPETFAETMSERLSF